MAVPETLNSRATKCNETNQSKLDSSVAMIIFIIEDIQEYLVSLIDTKRYNPIFYMSFGLLNN
jgi:hypothetical protein